MSVSDHILQIAVRIILTLVASLGLMAVAMAAPLPAPTGFLWELRDVTLNPDNGTFRFSDIDLSYSDSNRSVGNPEVASVDLSKSFMAVPGSTGTGKNVGDLYYDSDMCPPPPEWGHRR